MLESDQGHTGQWREEHPKPDKKKQELSRSHFTSQCSYFAKQEGEENSEKPEDTEYSNSQRQSNNNSMALSKENSKFD